MANGNATIIVGSARQEHSAVFSACQVLFHTIYNEPVAGDRAHYALASRSRCRNSVAIFCTPQSEYAISVSAVFHISNLYGVSSVLPDCPEPVCDLLHPVYKTE